MKTFHLWLVLGLVGRWLVCPLCSAAEPGPTVDTVLANWEAASQKCRTLDARTTVFLHDAFHDEKPKITQGRFYYEAPNLGRYEVVESAEKATSWSHLSEAVIWNGKETLWIDGRRGNCDRFPAAKMQALLGQPESTKESGWSQFFAWFGQCARVLQGPQHFLPLVVGVRAAEVRERFEVTIVSSGKEILLKAVPKQPADKATYREMEVLLNAETYMTHATKEVFLNGRDRTVRVFDDEKINQRPSDRDQLLAPNLLGLHVTEWP